VKPWEFLGHNEQNCRIFADLLRKICIIEIFFVSLQRILLEKRTKSPKNMLEKRTKLPKNILEKRTKKGVWYA